MIPIDANDRISIQSQILKQCKQWAAHLTWNLGNPSAWIITVYNIPYIKAFQITAHWIIKFITVRLTVWALRKWKIFYFFVLKFSSIVQLFDTSHIEESPNYEEINQDVLSNESNETKKDESHFFNTTPEPSFNSSRSTLKMITQETHYFCRESHLCPDTKGTGSYRINNRAGQIAEITLKLFALLFYIFWIIPIKVWGSRIRFSLNKIHHGIFVVTILYFSSNFRSISQIQSK